MTIKVRRRPRSPQMDNRLIEMDGGLLDAELRTRPGFVGIDPSLAGFSMAAIDEEGHHYAWRFSPDKRFPMVMRLVAIEMFVGERLKDLAACEIQVAVVAMENPSFGSEFGREILGAVQAMTFRALLTGFPEISERTFPHMVAPNSLKKFVTGKGVGPKDQISKYLFKKFDIDVPNVTGANDLADSIGLSLLARSLYVDEPTTQAERDVLKTVRQKTEWVKYQEHVSTMREKPLSSGSARRRR